MEGWCSLRNDCANDGELCKGCVKIAGKLPSNFKRKEDVQPKAEKPKPPMKSPIEILVWSASVSFVFPFDFQGGKFEAISPLAVKMTFPGFTRIVSVTPANVASVTDTGDFSRLVWFFEVRRDYETGRDFLRNDGLIYKFNQNVKVKLVKGIVRVSAEESPCRVIIEDARDQRDQVPKTEPPESEPA